ncbi:MAG TPA: GNAT family N-acetyltransferase [Clostridia bacterium]|nr:GNAT family N-acetyltransferase [Clostridia bacterium]
MRIYSFNELSEEQKRNIYQFTDSFKSKNSYGSYDEMVKLYEGVAFDHGSSYFSLWDDKRPVATIGVISKEAEARGEIFLVCINIKEQDSHKLSKLLSKAYDYCSGIKAAKFRLGVMHDRYYLISELEKSGYVEVNRNLIMRYCGGNIGFEEDMDKCFKPLSPENIKDYQRVESAAFLQAPNGGVVEDEELQGLLDEYCGSNLAGVFYAEDIPAGTYTLRIKDDDGWIESIGVAPEYQGRGIGRMLLHKSIKVLQAVGVKNIKLSVFDTNTRALTLYKKDGFEVESEPSIWYEK